MAPNKRCHDLTLSSRQTQPDAAIESIELTTQRKRDLLAAVGFLDEDDELPEVHLAGCSIAPSNNKLASNGGDDEEYYHEREERRRRKQRLKNENMIDFDEVELESDDEEDGELLVENTSGQYYDDDDSYCSRDDEYHGQYSDDEQPSSRGNCCYITTKVAYILIIVAAFNYIFGDDSTTLDNSEQEPIKKEYYSYKGYKDGRIPDDDSLLRGEEFDSTSSDGVSFDYGPNTKNNIDTTSFEVQNGMDASFHKHKTGVPDEDLLWHNLAGYADLSEPYNPSSSDIAFFWHIPKCGGTTLQDLMMHCLGMVGANEVGGTYANNEPLEIVQLDNGNRYVNVDVSQPDGIQHAHDLGFASSGLADVVLSSRFHNAAILFTPNDSAQSDVAKGRCFTLLRHPVKRAISMFYYLRDATWENTYNKIYQNMTIEEYAVSQYAEDNWMGKLNAVRSLFFQDCCSCIQDNFLHSQ